MKHQLCRNCGHRHPLGGPCTFKAVRPPDAQDVVWPKGTSLDSNVIVDARKKIAADPSLTITPTRVEQAEIRKSIPPAVVKNPFARGRVLEKREDVLLKPPTKILMPAFSSEEDVAAAKKLVAALTPAEKQKRYRASGDVEAKRKRDRERKATKRRDGPDGT